MLYSILVLDMGIAPDYVLDRMEIYEINALFENRYLRQRESWEQARMLSFVIAKSLGSKINGVRDIFSLPWDEETKRETIEADYSQLDRLKAMSQYIIKNELMN